MTTTSSRFGKPVLVSRVEGVDILTTLGLPIEPAFPQWWVEGGEWITGRAGVRVTRIASRGCPVEYQIDAHDTHEIWLQLEISRVMLPMVTRIRADAEACELYASYLVHWAMRNRIFRLPCCERLDAEMAINRLISYMLRFEVADAEHGEYAAVLIDEVAADGFARYDNERQTAAQFAVAS